MTERDPNLMVLIGAPKAGKSFFELNMLGTRERVFIIPSSNRENTFVKFNPNVKIVRPVHSWVPNPFAQKEGQMMETWTIPGIRDYTGIWQLDMSPARNREDQKKILDACVDENTGFVDGLFIIDDYKTQLPGSILRTKPADFFRDFRKRGNDVIISAHKLADVHADLISFDCHVGVFRTKKKGGKNWLENLNDGKAEEILALQNKVNRICENGIEGIENWKKKNPGKTESEAPDQLLRTKYHYEFFTP